MTDAYRIIEEPDGRFVIEYLWLPLWFMEFWRPIEFPVLDKYLRFATEYEAQMALKEAQERVAKRHSRRIVYDTRAPHKFAKLVKPVAEKEER